MPSVAPWLVNTPADFAASAQRGAGLGQAAVAERNRVAMENQRLGQAAQSEQAQLAMAAQRLAAEQKQNQVQMQIAKEEHERNFLLGQQRNEIAQAYHTASIGVRQQKLADAAKASALRMAAQRKLAALTAAGVPFNKALLQVPELLGAGAETVLAKLAGNPPVPRMSDIDKLAYGTAQRDVTAGEKEGPEMTGMWPFRTEHPNKRAESARAAMEEIRRRYDPEAGKNWLTRAIDAKKAGVTHTWNPATGSIEPIAPDATEPVTPDEEETPDAEDN